MSKNGDRPKRKSSGRKSEAVTSDDAPHRIVYSPHLVSERSPESSEFEFGMILAVNSFNRWVVRCMAAAVKDMSKLDSAAVKDMSKLDKDIKDISILEALLLHHVQGHEKKLADICFMYNIEDTHVVSYSLKKLYAAGLVNRKKIGKEQFYFTTPLGAAVIESYRRVREECLVGLFSQQDDEKRKLGEMAEFLRDLAGLYDQASRRATARANSEIAK